MSWQGMMRPNRGQATFMSSSLIFFGIVAVAVIVIILLTVFAQRMFGVTF